MKREVHDEMTRAWQSARRRARVLGVTAWRRVPVHYRPGARRVLLLARRSVTEFRDDQCLQLAGSIAFHVLLSIFPLLIVVVALFGILSDSATVRDTVVDTITTYIPLSDSGRADLANLLSQLQGGASALGLLGLVGVVVSAGGMMGSVRRALTLAWDAEEHRPFLRGKAFDLVLVAGATVVLGGSFVLTIGVRLATQTGYDATGKLAFLAPLLSSSRWVVGLVAPMLMAFALFAFLYSVVPAVPTKFVEVWPGALVAAVLFQILKELFAVYLANFAHYGAVYGSLGAVAAFIFFVFLSANVLLFGAEIAAEYPRLPG